MKSRMASLVVVLACCAAAPGLAAEIQVNTYTTGNQGFPAVASDDDGDFVVVWNGAGNGDTQGVFGQRYDSGGSALGTEFLVNTYTTGGQDTAAGAGQVASDADGDFVVVWSGAGQSDTAGVFAQRFASDGSVVGTEFRVNTYTTALQSFATVASDADGDFVVVWTSSSQDGSGLGVFGQRYASDGSAVATEFQVSTSTTDDQFFPMVSSDADGDFVVVWNDGVFPLLFTGIGQRYASSGNPVGTEFAMGGIPAVASDADGDFVVVSQTSDGDGDGVFGQRYDSDGNTVGLGFQVNTYTTGDQGRAVVASDADGDFAVAWHSSPDQFFPSTGQDGSGEGVFSQRYASNGNAVGPEFGVNTYTTNDQYAPGIASDATGNFVVVWQSVGQDSSGSLGVFGQRFDASTPTPTITPTATVTTTPTVTPPAGCPISVDAGCVTGFARGFLLQRSMPGSEKLIAKLLKGPAITQAELGNPLMAGGTVYQLCVYDGGGDLTGGLTVDRAGDTGCSGGSTACWSSVGPAPPEGKGYKYKDADLAAQGVAQILLKGGAAGKSKIVLKGRGGSLPNSIPAALTATSSVTIQLRGSDAPAPGCFSITLNDIKKQEADFFKAK